MRCHVTVALLLLAVACGSVVYAQPAPATAPAIVRVETRVTYADGSSQATTLPSAPQPAPVPPAKFVGWNIGAITDSTIFADAIRGSRKWGTTAKPYDASAPVDANGELTGDGAAFWAQFAGPAGDWKFQCDGKAIISCSAPSTVLQQQTGTFTTAVIRVAATRPVDFFVKMSGTVGGVKNVHFYRPDTDTGYQTSRAFRNRVKGFYGLRLMDFGRTNGNKLKEWKDAPKLTDPQWTGENGAPRAADIILANETQQPIQVHIPLEASDDYVRQWAKMVRDYLNPGLVCYVTLSNETWHIGPGFDGARNVALGTAELAAGDKTLNPTDQYRRGWERVARRLVEINKLTGPNDGRFRFVLEGQVANPSVLEVQLAYVDRNFGPPDRWFYSAAGAPYVNAGITADGKRWISVPGLTVDSIVQRFIGVAPTAANGPKTQAQHAIAKRYNLHSFGYEGYFDFEQAANDLSVKFAAQDDPRLYDAGVAYLHGWFDGGGEGIYLYKLADRYTQSNLYGALSSVDAPDNGKYRAAQAVAAEVNR